MADASAAINNTPGVNPTTQAGRVVQNGTKDEKELSVRKANNENNDTLYHGQLTDAHYTMAPGELAFSLMTDKRPIKYMADGTSTVHAFSSLNQFGRSTENVDDLIEKVVFVGIVSTWALQDTLNHNNDTGVVLHVGGLITAPNTGHMALSPGKRVYWDFPDPTVRAVEANPTIKGTPKDKILGVLKQYDVNVHGTTAKAVFRHLSRALGLPGSAKTSRQLKATSASLLAKRAGIWFAGLRTTVLLGIIALDAAEAGTSNKPVDARAIAGYVEKARVLGLLGKGTKQQSDKTKAFEHRFVKTLFCMGLSSSGEPIEAGLGSLLFGQTKKQAGGLANNTTLQREIIELENKQLSAVGHQLTGLRGMADHIGRRVIGTIKMGGKGGESVDILVGTFGF